MKKCFTAKAWNQMQSVCRDTNTRKFVSTEKNPGDVTWLCWQINLMRIASHYEFIKQKCAK